MVACSLGLAQIDTAGVRGKGAEGGRLSSAARSKLWQVDPKPA